MILEQDVRDKFEAWALQQNHNLTRHPTNNDFYYNRDVSMLWVCYAEAYATGRMDENASIQDMLEEAFDDAPETELPEVAQILFERNEGLDE